MWIRMGKPRKIPCGNCEGTGVDPDSEEICGRCDGAGYVEIYMVGGDDE